MSERRAVADRVGGTLSTGRRRWLTSGVAALGLSSLILGGLASPAAALDQFLSTLTINQVLDPGDGPGSFNLEIDGTTAGTGADVGNGGTTGAVAVSSGAHSVGVTAGTGTDLAHYESSTSCTANGVPVVLDGDEVMVASGQDVVCTITLVPKPIIVVDPLPDRCASSRGGRDCPHDHDDPEVDPAAEEEEEVDGPSIPTTTAAPVTDPATTVAGGGEQLAVPAPVDQVLAGGVERSAPAPAATLPRTGMGIGRQVTLAFGLIGAGIVSLALAHRRRPAAQAAK